MQLRSTLLPGFCLFAMATTGAAQSLQRLSVQASGAVLIATKKDPTFESRTRLGWEGQLRYTFGRFSLGGGYQRSTVFAFTNPDVNIDLSLGFVEPRMVVTAGGSVAGYLAGRLGVGRLLCGGNCRSESNFSYGGGAGLLFRLSRRLSGDLGAQFFQVGGSLSSGYAMVRAGLGVGL